MKLYIISSELAECTKPVMVVGLWGIKSIFLFVQAEILIFTKPTRQLALAWSTNAETLQTKMLVVSHEVNTNSIYWSSWKANASIQEWLYKTTDVITTEGVVQKLGQFNLFLYSKYRKMRVSRFFTNQKKRNWMSSTAPNMNLLW